MGLAAQTRSRRGGQRRGRTRSNYAGAALNASVVEALSGVSAQPDAALFVEDRRGAAGEHSARAAARAKRAELDFAEQIAAARGPSRAHELLVARAGAGPIRPKAEPKKQTFVVLPSADLWGADEAAARDEWPLQLTNAPGKRRAREVHSRKSTDHVVPAVRVVPEGASYNPSVAAHKAALGKVVSEQLSFDARAKRITTIAAQERAAALARTPADAVESSDESSNEDEDEEQDMEEDAQLAADASGGKNKLQPGERLTRAQRNKDRRKRLAAAELALKTKTKGLLAQADAVKAISREVEEDEADLAERRKETAERRKARLLVEPLPRMSSGKAKYLPPPVDVVLPSDLAPTMRELKPHGGLASDRMISMLKRNMIELSDPDAHKRYVWWRFAGSA
jgi:nucleolar protein 53